MNKKMKLPLQKSKGPWKKGKRITEERAQEIGDLEYGISVLNKKLNQHDPDSDEAKSVIKELNSLERRLKKIL